MTEEQQKKKFKSKKKQVEEIKLGDAFDPANAKEKDFDLDLDAAKFQGKKGQAGTRSKLNPPDPYEHGGGDTSAAMRALQEVF